MPGATQATSMAMHEIDEAEAALVAARRDTLDAQVRYVRNARSPIARETLQHAIERERRAFAWLSRVRADAPGRG